MKRRLIPPLCALLWYAAALLPAVTQAGVMAATTRVIMVQGQQNQTLMLVNTNSYPVIVQTWVDQGQADPDSAQTPFVSLPVVFRLEPAATQGLRIVLDDDGTLAQDRESVFWLNLYEIPPTTGVASAQQSLALAMNTQLKIFYRPKGLPSVTDLPKQLRFQLRQVKGHWFVQCDNPTPYHVSFLSLEVVHGDQSASVQSEMDMMTPPYTQRRYLLGDTRPSGKILRYVLVDDTGFAQTFTTALSS